MKRNLVNFTRGSQLLGHFSFMFAAGLKGPLIIAAIIAGLIGYVAAAAIAWAFPRGAIPEYLKVPDLVLAPPRRWGRELLWRPRRRTYCGSTGSR